MKKTVAGGDGGGGGGGGGERKSLRNRRRRVLDDDRPPPPPLLPPPPPPPPAATITSGALLRLQTVHVTPVDARDSSAASAVTDDWLFADWLDGSGGTTTASGTHVTLFVSYYYTI
uniref:Uncharacterized protein n=1 Tax=Sipha flava TaxID=143950 RepID=A0A2S2QUR0_9HEMI